MVSPIFLNRNIVSSLVMYTYIAVCVDKSRLDADANVFLSSLVNLVSRVCSAIDSVPASTLHVGMGFIVIDRLGQVVGFVDCLLQGLHCTIQQMVITDP